MAHFNQTCSARPNRFGRIAKAFAIVSLAIGTASFAAAQSISLTPMTYVVNYSTLNTVTFPQNYYAWNQSLGIGGAGWRPVETLEVHLYGPLNTPNSVASDRLLGKIITSIRGTANIGTNVDGTPNIIIPYNQTSVPNVKNNKTIPIPGYYSLIVKRPNAQTIFDEVITPITVAPYTLPELDNGGWSRSRGGRDGILLDVSPERTDPEWISAWTEAPISLYGTIAPAVSQTTIDDPPANQPTFIASQDYPFTHFAHDVNMEVLPDPAYMWTVGTANFVGETKYDTVGTKKANYGRIECEWETLNNGSPTYGSYGQGTIGMPLWVTPSAGDRVFMVGRWALDNGHPDSGDRTEIHPPMMLATMRTRNTAVPFNAAGAMTRAGQVDVYISGQGGGSNLYPDGLSETIDSDSPGGVIMDKLTTDQLTAYFDFGPDPGDVAQTVLWLYEFIHGGNGVDASEVRQVAGPSALGWAKGKLIRDINTMDYDFDVPLPVSPVGATTPKCLIHQQAGHSTAVQEVITYTTPDGNGLPTVAHFHIPCKGGDNYIFAKTFNFYWDVFSAPGRHYQVSFSHLVMNTGAEGIPTGSHLQLYDGPGPLFMWADVCGQWRSLTDADPGSLTTPTRRYGPGALSATFSDAYGPNRHAVNVDVYLDLSDSMRVFTEGYAQRSFDGLFGKRMNDTSYNQASLLALSQKLDTGSNQSVGATLFDKQIVTNGVPNAITGFHNDFSNRKKTSQPGALDGNEDDPVTSVYGNPLPDPIYGMQYTITYVPRPAMVNIAGGPISFGRVQINTSASKVLQIQNRGDLPLTVSSISVSGAGLSAVTSPTLPFTVPAYQSVPVTVIDKPTTSDALSGSVTIQTNDLVYPIQTVPVTGTVAYPIFGAKADTTTVPTVTVGSSYLRPITLGNSGTSPLVIYPVVSGRGYSLVLPASYYVNGILSKPITILPGTKNLDLGVLFTCTSPVTNVTGTLTMGSNDPNSRQKVLTFHTNGSK